MPSPVANASQQGHMSVHSDWSLQTGSVYLNACHPAAEEWHALVRSDGNTLHRTIAATKIMQTIEHSRPGCRLPPAIFTSERLDFHKKMEGCPWVGGGEGRQCIGLVG